jgi:predicted DNA-binding transcriptional regulator AlpA
MRELALNLTSRRLYRRPGTVRGGVAAPIERFNLLPDEGRVRIATVEALFGISTATVARWVQQGRLPAPQHDGRMRYWTAGALRASLRAGGCDGQ